jgi:hypothetical protein
MDASDEATDKTQIVNEMETKLLDLIDTGRFEEADLLLQDLEEYIGENSRAAVQWRAEIHVAKVLADQD